MNQFYRLADNLDVSDVQRFTPGSAGSTLISLRMNHRNDDAMPPLGSTVVDNKGDGLVEGWINDLTGCCG